ncbi:hypothetical protein [Lacrimispora indolis]|uniref:hypothetical protein n=1 Tax=Lacrimispora indolis TaxID=69825 RepID=UPI00045E7151|nr:hypothetical protein [Lacrimispora indolis]
MIRLEEYIAKRKMEDHLNEFDMELKVSNIKKSIEYIFEYFSNYLPLEGAEDHSAEENERINKYEKALREYSPELSRWFVTIYDETGHQVSKTIQKYCDNTSGFLLTFEDSEFRTISYNCYAELIKKRPCLRDETERLYQFIKEYHAVVTKREYEYFGFPQISEKITTWLNDTYIKYNVNLAVAIKKYLTEEFYNNVDMLPSGSKNKSDHPYRGHIYKYNYKNRTNLFNINGYYSRFGNKPFLNGKKKSIEILMMFTWLGDVSGEDSDFFQKYLAEFKEY